MERGRLARLEPLALRVLGPPAVVLVLLGLVEAACRAAGHDFARAARERVAPGLRPPGKWDGTVLRKDGRPRTWRGQPLRSGCRAQGLDDARLQDEPEVEVTYDRLGFRNADDLERWTVAVAGDELTEQGDLPADALFTARLAAALRVPVKNLGCAGASLCFQVEYLRRWGLAPGCTTWVVVFDEADDLVELPGELLHRTGLRSEHRILPTQPSPTVALLELLAAPFAGADDPVNGYLLGEGATDVPVTFVHAPPASEQLGAPLRAMFVAGLEEYRAQAAAAGVEPWLAYMPAKERLYHAMGRIEYVMPPYYIANWRPNDLPAWVGAACARAGVRFVDLTPDLLRQARDRRAPRPFHDVFGHGLTAAGSRVVGDALARALGGGE